MINVKLILIVDYLKKLNFYVSTDEDTQQEYQDQILSTRIFILLFIVSLIGLFGYSTLSYQLTIQQIQNPDQITFENLNSRYSDTLICPCSQTSIEFNQFLQVDLSYHQICSSIFVSDEWISSQSHSIPTLFYSLDIRRMISSEFQLISSQCESSKVAVKDVLATLSSNQFFIPTMLSKDFFNSRMSIIVDEVKNEIIAQQQQSRNLIEVINQQNQLASGLSNTHLYLNINYTNQGFYIVKFLNNETSSPRINFTQYDQSQLCSCVDTYNCTYPGGIYSSLTGSDSSMSGGILIPPTISHFPIPGLKVGCMPFTSIMESTLQCFYSNHCLSHVFPLTNQTALNKSILSRFSINTKIGVLIEELFLENFFSRTNFSGLFEACKVKTCTYSYNARGQIAFIISTILSLVGGLSVALKIVASVIVTIYRTIQKRFENKSSSIPSIIVVYHQNQSRGLNKRITYVKKIFTRVREQMMSLNLFKRHYNDAIGRRNEIIMTRCYLLLMIIGLFIIGFYASFVEHTLTYYVQSPSLSTYRQIIGDHPDFSCECLEISSPYSTFVSFTPRFHQACSSIFVSDTFIPRYRDNNRPFPLARFILRLAVPGYYASGRAVCSLGQSTTFRSIDTFLQTIYVSTSLTIEKEFQSRIKSVVDHFKALAPTTFTHLLQLIRDTTKGNQLLSASFTNAKLEYPKENLINTLWINPNDQSCNCGLSSNSCALSHSKYCNFTFGSSLDEDNSCYSSVPGLIIACYLVDGSYISTIECLYDIDCARNSLLALAPGMYETLEAILPSIILQTDIQSRFQPNSTIGEILDALGIERWNEKINYTRYYNHCNPTNCFYTFTKKFNIPTVITTIVGLLGGLSVILRILISPIIKFLRQQRTTRVNNVTMSLQESRFHRFIRQIRQMNLFKTAQTDNSNEIREEQIIITRLYIILWVISVSVVTISTGLSQQNKRILIKSPTIDHLYELQSSNLNEFQCPCSKITIPFGRFTSFNYTLHEICSSHFIEDLWLKSLFDFSDKQIIGRGVLSSHFELLRSFCVSSKKTLSDAINNFYANQLISVFLLTEKQFNDQSETTIGDYEKRIISSFQRNLALIIDITLGNQLMSIYQTNWYFIPDPHGTRSIYTHSTDYQMGNCSCSTPESRYCIDPLFITENVSVPGMFIGCLPITSLRLSSLKCFYDQLCLNQIKEIIHLTNISIVSLYVSQSSNKTLGEIIDNLMLKQWIHQINYTEYLNECQPIECTHLILQRNHFLVVFTTLLGLYGGLIIILDFSAPIIVKIGRKIFKKCQSNRQIRSEFFSN